MAYFIPLINSICPPNLTEVEIPPFLVIKELKFSSR